MRSTNLQDDMVFGGVFCVVLLVSPLVSSVTQYSCYAEVKDPYLELGTKTAYEHEYNRNGIPALEGCKAVQLWLLSRHGTRYPRPKHILPLAELAYTRDSVLLNYKMNKTMLCEKDIENLRNWQYNVEAQDANMLTTQGRYDLYNLARRLKTYFPDLLSINYTSNKFIFRHTKEVRTKESAEYFAKGLFGLNFNEPLPFSNDDDRFLHSYKYCPAREEGTTLSREVMRWEQGPEMMSVVSNVNQRLGFVNDITMKNVSMMYDMCRYQKAWDYNKLSPWCAVFSDIDLKVMEYGDDLKVYYGSGPGNDIAIKLACPLIKDMVNHFTQIEKYPEAANPRAFFYFSHDTLLSMVIARLGLEPESLPPTADNYQEQQYRLFRTSRFLPFATNVFSVLYNCNGDKLKTVLYHAESPIEIAGCSQSVCDWNYIKKWFGQFVDVSSCTDNSFCFNKANSHTSFSLSCVVLLTLLAYYVNV